MTPALLLLALAQTSTTTADFGYLLVVTDAQGAVVRVDGRRMGRTPLPTLRLPVGEHEVEVEEIGYGRFVARVTIEKDAFSRLEAVVTPRAIPRISPAERLGIRTDQEGQGAPIITRTWFLALAGVVAAAVVATGFVLASGGDFVPEGELGNTSTRDWERF